MESSKPKVSVVIPIYNVEKYLPRCIESVINQTLEDIEIILVDDGSPDGSPRICDEYAKKDSRIRVIHKTNGGLASARNAGMTLATGKYLFFVDSDDWLELDGLSTLYVIGEKEKVDFVRFRAIRTGWPGTNGDIACRVETIRELKEGLYDKRRIIDEIYPRLLATDQLTMGAIVGAWESLYKLDFLRTNNLSFYDSVKFSEDLIFSANVVKCCNSFYFVDTPGVYHYFYNPNSISKSFREGRWESCKQLIELAEKDFLHSEEYDFSKELIYLKWFCIMLGVNERKYLKTYKSKKEYCKKILSDPMIKDVSLNLKMFDVSFKQKCLMFLIKKKKYRMVALT